MSSCVPYGKEGKYDLVKQAPLHKATSVSNVPAIFVLLLRVVNLYVANARQSAFLAMYVAQDVMQ